MAILSLTCVVKVGKAIEREGAVVAQQLLGAIEACRPVGIIVVGADEGRSARRIGTIHLRLLETLFPV